MNNAFGGQTLLLDDDEFALMLLAQRLAHVGCGQTTACLEGQQALTLIAQQPDAFGLVFCDLQMPGMDGVEFVRKLAQIKFRGGLVLLSGESGRVLKAAQKLASALGFEVFGAFEKPVSTEQLRQVLQARANHHARQPATPVEQFGPDELARALSDGELLNHYQPKVDMASGRLRGFEALVRWQHPRAGLVYPDRFIGTAEQHGLIAQLTQVVLGHALRQARVWRDARLELRVAVNLSMDNLSSLDFPEIVMDSLRRAGVEPSALILEVTESRLATDLRAPLDILTRLRLKRIGLSIDDFGTGHSSLAQLRDLPFDELKLDRSFIHGATADASLQAIVKGSIAMAASLGMKSVAEGLEQRSDWDLLRGLGCDLAQGYFIGKPMPAEALPDWMASWQQRQASLQASAG